MKLILNDDDASVRRILALSAISYGHTVHQSNGFEQTVDMVSAHPDVDAVVTDLMGSGGAQIVDYLHENHPHIPVFLMTGTILEIADQTRSKVVAVFTKPLNIRQMFDTIERLKAA